VPWEVVVRTVVAVLLGWLVAVPSWVALRTWRRRRSGTVADAVAEARDLLRANDVPVTAAMTVRDMAAAGNSAADALARLADAVDATLWSGAGVDARQEAWEAVRALRSGLARRPARARLRAALRYGYRAQVAPRMPVGALR
jgi:hypothetical protein